MRTEPTEISLAKTGTRIGAVSRSTTRLTADEQFATADVLDQAFADFSRVDVPDSRIEAAPYEAGTHSATEPRSMSKELVADIARQLNALDRQREQLAALLSRVDASTLNA